MHIFIDESGQAIPSAKDQIACVAALIVPDSQLNNVNQWFLALEQEQGKLIKGKDIQQDLRDRILKDILKFDVFVECTAIDMALHSNEIVSQHKKNRATFIENTFPTTNPILQKMRSAFAKRIKETSNQLYLQAILTWHLVELALRHGTIYYSQKRPEELSAFHWVIDPKEAGHVIPFEKLWTELVMPYLQCQPPLLSIEGHDYSYLERFSISDADIESYHTDSGEKLRKEDRPLSLNKIMTEYLAFPDDNDTPGLRLADVISNAIFKSLNGGPNFKDFQNIGPLFFIRKPLNCVTLQTLCKDIPAQKIRERHYREVLLAIEKKNRPIWIRT